MIIGKTYTFYVALLVILTLAPTESTECPDDFVAYGESCYLFAYDTHLTFYEAEHYCRQHHGGHLVHVESQHENAFIKQFLAGLKAQPYWLGLTDELVEGVWQWYDTETPVTYTNWWPGQPGTSAEDCAVIKAHPGFEWDDYPCNKSFATLCEIRNDDAEIVG